MMHINKYKLTKDDYKIFSNESFILTPISINCFYVDEIINLISDNLIKGEYYNMIGRIRLEAFNESPIQKQLIHGYFIKITYL